MNSPVQNPRHWRVSTLLSLETEQVHELACWAVGTLTAYRLVLGRCLLALHENKGHKKYGCSTAVHYGCSVLGTSVRVARECKRVAERLQFLPQLTVVAEGGKMTWSKLREIVRVASPETEEFWMTLAADNNADMIQKLVRKTPEGALPGDADIENTCTTEFRIAASPELIQMFRQARRMFGIEQDKAVTGAETLEYLLASFLASQPLDPEVLAKVKAETDKDLQAERAREIPEVLAARDLAQEMGLLQCEQPEQKEESVEELLTEAIGAMPDLSDSYPALEMDQVNSSRKTCTNGCCSSLQPNASDCVQVTGVGGEAALSPMKLLDASDSVQASGVLGEAVTSPSKSFRVPDGFIEGKDLASIKTKKPLDTKSEELFRLLTEELNRWRSTRVGFNPRARRTTTAQSREIQRRDGWQCSCPACPNVGWLHLHHIVPYSEGGPTTPENLITLCSGCHRNLHNGFLKITPTASGKLIFTDPEGRRLDQQADLELASWLDYHVGWRGTEYDSHQLRAFNGEWAVFA